MSALLSVLDQTIELCARHKEALAEIVRLRDSNRALLEAARDALERPSVKLLDADTPWVVRLRNAIADAEAK